MFKKISTIILMSAMLLIGGLFQTSVDAAAGVDKSQSNYSKGNDRSYFYVNNWHNEFRGHFNKWYKSKWHYKYSNKAKRYKQNNTNADKEKVEQPKQEEVEEKPKPVEQVPEKQPAPAPTPNEEGNNVAQIDQLNAYEQQVFDLTNNERVKNGLAPFQIDLELSRVAREKSRDMSGSNYFAHNSPTYGSPFDMMKSYGITYRTAGENIAKGQQTPAVVVNAWMNSPGHRANILNGNFTHIGVGYVEQGKHWTQQFIGK